jgi:hypothetical protein
MPFEESHVVEKVCEQLGLGRPRTDHLVRAVVDGDKGAVPGRRVTPLDAGDGAPPLAVRRTC